MRAKPSSRVQEETPITIANFTNRLEEPLWVRYVELMRLRQAVLEAESTRSNHTLLKRHDDSLSR
jgi:hypothetical protein